MSAIDTAARGMAARARIDAGARCAVLAAQDRTGPIAFTGTSQTYRTALSAMLPPGAIIGGCQLRIRAHVAKHTPVAAGHAWRVSFAQGGNRVTLAQNSFAASALSALVDQSVFVSSDRRWGFTHSQNAMNAPSLAIGQLALTGASGGAPAGLGASQVSSQIAFASYSAAPITETLLIDFARPVELRVEIAGQGGDVLELVGFCAEMSATGNRAANFVPAGAICCWGDSLTQGSGATAVAGVPQDYPAQLRRARAGSPLVNRGLGGQTASQIVDRLTADDVQGRHWDAVCWIGINDASGNGPAWWATVETQIDRLLAFRAPTARTLFLNYHPRSDWPDGNPFNTALRHVNARLAAKLGTRLVDVSTPILAGGTNGTPNPAYLVDTIHLNNTGYGVVASTVAAAMAAAGW